MQLTGVVLAEGAFHALEQFEFELFASKGLALPNGLEGLLVLFLSAPGFHAELEFGTAGGGTAGNAIGPEKSINPEP